VKRISIIIITTVLTLLVSCQKAVNTEAEKSAIKAVLT